MSWAGGVFNQWLESAGGLNDNETVLMGRVTGVAYEDEKRLVHIGLTNRYSNGKNGAQYGIRPEFNKSVRFIETGFMETNHMNLVSTELSYLQGPFWVFSEYVSNNVNSVSDGSLHFSSFHITGSWVLTGEHRTYRYQNGTINPIPVANGVNQGGWGALELAARFSTYDLNDKSINGGSMAIYSLGLNWWLSTSASFSFNIRHINTSVLDSKGSSIGLNTRIMLIID